MTVSGNAIINGMGTFADKGGKVTIGGSGSDIKTGESVGIAATNGGNVEFGGGTITVDTNSGDTAMSFYADGTSKINFTGATAINMTKGNLVVENTSVYTAAAGTATRYNGMGNVTLNVSGDAKVIKTSDGETGVVWNGGSGFAGTVQSDMKLASATIGANNFTAYYLNGDYTINADVRLGDSTDAFNNVFMTRELVTINSGKTVSSTNGTGLAMASNSSATSNAVSGYINNGTVNITGGGTSKAAVNVSYGTIQNNNVITTDNGAAVY